MTFVAPGGGELPPWCQLRLCSLEGGAGAPKSVQQPELLSFGTRSSTQGGDAYPQSGLFHRCVKVACVSARESQAEHCGPWEEISAPLFELEEEQQATSV